MSKLHEYGQYAHFVDTISCAAVMTTFDADHPVILAANKAHEELTGFKTDAILGMTPKEVFSPMTQSGSNIRKELKEHFSYTGIVWNTNAKGKLVKYDLLIVPVILGEHKFYVGVKKVHKEKCWFRNRFCK